MGLASVLGIPSGVDSPARPVPDPPPKPSQWAEQQIERPRPRRVIQLGRFVFSPVVFLSSRCATGLRRRASFRGFSPHVTIHRFPVAFLRSRFDSPFALLHRPMADSAPAAQSELASTRVETIFIAAATNRHSHAADCAQETSLVAFGSNRFVGLWDASVSRTFHDNLPPMPLTTGVISEE